MRCYGTLRQQTIKKQYLTTEITGERATDVDQQCKKSWVDTAHKRYRFRTQQDLNRTATQAQLCTLRERHTSTQTVMHKNQPPRRWHHNSARINMRNTTCARQFCSCPNKKMRSVDPQDRFGRVCSIQSPLARTHGEVGEQFAEFDDVRVLDPAPPSLNLAPRIAYHRLRFNSLLSCQLAIGV